MCQIIFGIFFSKLKFNLIFNRVLRIPLSVGSKMHKCFTIIYYRLSRPPLAHSGQSTRKSHEVPHSSRPRRMSSAKVRSRFSFRRIPPLHDTPSHYRFRTVSLYAGQWSAVLQGRNAHSEARLRHEYFWR